MSLLLQLLITFFKLGLVSFGGGYAMIPLIQAEVESHRWLSTGQFTDIIAVSAMAPGPIATNSATIIGYKLSNFPGALVACVGVTLPSLLLILILGRLFSKFREHPLANAVFYGLRPTITGIIAFAAIKFAIGNGIIGGTGIVEAKGIIITVVSFTLLIRTKIHPIFLILASSVIGMILYM